MGVTIHYRGRLRQKQDIETLTNEVEDLCKSADWKYHLWDGMDEDKPLHGISFQTHPESESFEQHIVDLAKRFGRRNPPPPGQVEN